MRRQSAYASMASGVAVRNVTRPMSLASQHAAARLWVSGVVQREPRDRCPRTIAWTVRVVWRSSTRAPTRSGRFATWQAIASISRVVAGGLAIGAIRSPRVTSRSSARRTVTDCDAQAAGTLVPIASMAAIFEVTPEGSTTTRSPIRSTPEATWPA